MQNIRILRLDSLPIHAPAEISQRDATLPLVAALPDGEEIVLKPRERVAIPTGVAVELPLNVEGQVRGLPQHAEENGVAVLNSPGTIDPDYRGEIKVILINLSEHEIRIKSGEKIAVLAFRPFAAVSWIEVDELPETKRGSGGLGSTGKGGL